MKKKGCKNTKKIRTQKINRNWANESVIDAKYIEVGLVGHMQLGKRYVWTMNYHSTMKRRYK